MIAKELVTEYMQKVWVEKDVSVLDRFVDANLIQHNPNLPNGLEGLRGFLLRMFGEMMPNLKWRVLRIIAENDMVVVHSHAVPTAGAPGAVVVDLFRVADGLIVEHWDVTRDVPTETTSGNTVY